ncbi:phosphopantetheine-binding protein [Streptomyces microflavus]|uniref:phosphopantetheine-binding protein n=1 Tax=Streptomyces microflavus TaxID=1919 RepID=UPI00382482F8
MPHRNWTDDKWTDDFESVLRPCLPLLADGDPLEPEAPLADLGLDSLATVSLLVHLEEVFAVLVPDEELTLKTFATAGSLWSVIDGLREDVT